MGNRLSKLYTRTGDDGTTALADGKRVDKDSVRFQAMGDIDELNSILGVVIASSINDDIAGYLLNIQHRLFDIGAELSIPGNAIIEAQSTTRLEELIDNYNDELVSLKEFILPGGTMAGAICHLARTVCRRAERHLIELGRKEYVNNNTLCYINRLSDLLFVFARTITLSKGGKEVYWDKDRLKQSA